MLLFILGDTAMNTTYAEILKGLEAEPEYKVTGKGLLEGIQAEPSLTVSERYDDNINLTSSLQSDFITLLSPQITVLYKGLRLESSLLYQADVAFFKEHSDRNTVTHTAILDARYGLSQL